FVRSFLPPLALPMTPAAAPPPAEAPAWVHPRGRATIAASTCSPCSRKGAAPSLIFASDRAIATSSLTYAPTREQSSPSVGATALDQLFWLSRRSGAVCRPHALQATVVGPDRIWHFRLRGRRPVLRSTGGRDDHVVCEQLLELRMRAPLAGDVLAADCVHPVALPGMLRDHHRAACPAAPSGDCVRLDFELRPGCAGWQLQALAPPGN